MYMTLKEIAVLNPCEFQKYKTMNSDLGRAVAPTPGRRCTDASVGAQQCTSGGPQTGEIRIQAPVGIRNRMFVIIKEIANLNPCEFQKRKAAKSTSERAK